MAALAQSADTDGNGHVSEEELRARYSNADIAKKNHAVD